MAETSGFEEEIARKAVEYPLEVLDSDFQKAIREQDADYQSRIEAAYAERNPAVILRLIGLAQKSFRGNLKKCRLSEQLRRRMEDEAIPNDMSSLEASRQRYLLREATWDQLIQFKSPAQTFSPEQVRKLVEG